MTWRVAGLALVAAFVSGIQTTAALSGDLAAAEIERELVGRSILWWEDGGWQVGNLRLSADGTAEISVNRPARSGDTGRWSIRDGQICTAWTSLRAGAEKCYSIRRDDDGRFLTSGGNVFEIRELGV